jgi:hypothetical protein
MNETRLKNYNKNYYLKNKDRLSKIRLNWYYNNKNKAKCHSRIAYQLLKKLIIKPIYCQICDKIKELFSHHLDYNQPYLIIWICKSCHNKIHLGK